jgi:hypothetical protein
MPVLMSSVEMQDLAKKLAKMRYWRAKWTTWGMDRAAHYDMHRVSVSVNEYHTRITLPNKGIRVVFVERKEQQGEPNNRGLVRVKFRYVEARVEPIPEQRSVEETSEYVTVV